MPKRHGLGKGTRGVVARIDEVVLATSGADSFELVFALAAARLHARGPLRSAAKIREAALRAKRAWPWLELSSLDARAADGELLERVGALLEGALAKANGAPGEVLDAVFEELVTRVGKGQKGQFFTPRHVVDLAIGALGLSSGESVVDPACGSGAFLTHARAHARVSTWGCDVDGRAVRVAKLLAIAGGERHDARIRGDALSGQVRWPSRVDAVATNPPFAGRVNPPGFEVSELVHRAERDAFFLERAVSLLRPGGRLAIVLPHGKASATAWANLRRWLVQRARVFAVVSLPRETFLPHTSQRTVLLFAKKRLAGETPSPKERILFAASTRAGKDAAGDPIYRPGATADAGFRALDHDFAPIAARLGTFLSAEGFR